MSALVEPWTGVFTHALTGEVPCVLHGLRRSPRDLPVDNWRAPANQSDIVVLAHCLGPTLDIGCGPGRMTEHLARRGQRALGIDVVAAAVTQARERGVAALLCDVFGDVPGEGTWACALLADGNIGIGGDPLRLLRRVHELLAGHGRAVIDLAPPGAGLRSREVAIECGSRRSEPFAWAWVGPESVRAVSLEAGFTSAELHEHEGRWFAVLGKAQR